MDILSVKNKALLRLIEKGDASGLNEDAAKKLLRILAFLEAAASEDEFKHGVLWKAHKLSGDLAGVWSFHVTRNWRLIFRIDQTHNAIVDLDFVDYH